MEPPTIRMDMPADAYSGRLRHRRPLTEQGGAPIALLDPVVHIAETRLLDDCHRIGVWPDSVQVSGGGLSTRLPTRCLRCGSLSVCNPSGTAGEAWLERGLPSS